MEQKYTVTQAAEILGVRTSVLRYWEEELQLRISRNAQGHRYYTCLLYTSDAADESRYV